jgi:hypothetical protein
LTLESGALIRWCNEICNKTKPTRNSKTN